MNGHGGPSVINGMPNGLAGERQAAQATQPVPSTSTGGASEPAANGYPQPSPFQLHNDEIVNHLYHAGFHQGLYADTFVHVHQQVYRLHAIILSRSPFLAHLMSTTPQTTGQCNIYVRLEQEPEVTQEGFTIALGYLYSSESLNMLNTQNARAVLAAGCLLGGMGDLCNYAYEVCRQSITIDNIAIWLEFIESLPAPAPPLSSSASSDGTATPVEQHPPPLPRTAIYGPYAQRLRDDVFSFLVVALPSVLNVGGLATPASPHPDGPPPDAGRDTLLQIFSRVPFDMFKAAVESPTFQIGSDQARFKFAKDAVELRKRGIARGTGAEETVVLAFGGGGSGSAVHVTRKLRRRPLWKVNS